MSALDDFVFSKDIPINLYTMRLMSEAQAELLDIRTAIKEADNLLGCSLEFVEDMVGVASSARGLPEEIVEWHNKYKKYGRQAETSYERKTL